MSEIKLESIKKIPVLSRQSANEIASNNLKENKYIEELLDYIGFVDGGIANRIIDAAIKNNIVIEKVLLSINPFTDKSLNDRVVRLCMKKGVNAEGIVGKAFPFISLDVADELSEYAIKEECNPESLLNAAVPFVSTDIAKRIFEYAFLKKINPEFFSNKDFSLIHPHIAEMVTSYLDNVDSQVNNETIQMRLIRVFNESGIFLNSENYHEPLQLDSLHYISIICEIENEFDVEIPDEVLSENILSTFQDFLNLII